MRELFSMKAFRDASSQDGLISKAEYFRNKIDNRIIDFITQIGQGKKEWLSRGSVATLHKATSTGRVVDLPLIVVVLISSPLLCGGRDGRMGFALISSTPTRRPRSACAASPRHRGGRRRPAASGGARILRR